jgi:serine/threonine protein kinase
VESPEHVVEVESEWPEAHKKAGDEPLPGYRLIQPLGSGSFGEVWKCEVPGGLVKAIKFVAGNEGALDNSISLACQELAAFQRIKDIRHPFLLSMERVEVIAGELMIVMELADKSLHEVLEERQAAGLPGIPREELLGYLVEAAEALDVLNFQHGLQHLDIKPHNLFLVSNHVKVADFGLVNRLGQGTACGPGGGFTPLYCAPETLRGQISRHSDQYSLAIVYQELLTGTLPFRGGNARKLMFEHLTAAPILDPVPTDDRPHLARALAKEPEERFPSCLAFLRALIEGQSAPADVASHNPVADSRVLGLKRIRATMTAPGANAIRDTRSSGPGQTQKTPTGPVMAGPSGESVISRYRLLECLCQSLLVESWKAEEPDGTAHMAYLLSGTTGWQGAKVDRLIEDLRVLQHPALAPREVLQSPSGRVVVVTDYFKWSLRDRLQECLSQQLRGVPRDELLRYLSRVAQALDVLYKEHKVAHLGLNPRCMLLRNGEACLWDMGLVQLAWVAGGQPPGILNERYAAPELFESGGGPSSDQYSLALIYAEMLTGLALRRPRSTARSGAARTPAKLDLDLLPVGDRDVIARALCPEPQRRFASCTEMVQALLGPGPQESASRGRHSAGLPPVIPYGSLLGEQAPAGTVLPAVTQLVKDLMAAEPSLPRVHTHNGFRYRRLAGEVLEAQFAIRLWPGMMRLKLEGIRQHWNARVVQKGDDAFVLHVPFPVSFFQRCAGKKAGLEIHVQVQPPSGPDKQRSLAVARIQPMGDDELVLDRLLKMGPPMLESVRTHLQAQPEQRRHERLAWVQRVRVFPLLPGLELGEVIEGQAFDISAGGIGCLLPKAPPTREAFLHFDEVPRLAPFAILSRIVRTCQRPECDWRVGISFGGEEGQ